MTVPALGGAVRDLVPMVKEFSPSPDGREIAYLKRDAASREIALYIADALSGKNERLVFAPEPSVRIAEKGLSWSPKERAITVALSDENGEGCYLTNVSADDGSVNRFEKGLCNGSGSFAWLKDGSAMAFTTSVDDQRTQIWVLDLPSGERRRATNDAATYGSYSLSTTVGGVIVALAVKNYPSIWSMPSEAGAQPERLLQGSGRGEGAYGLAVAPDSKLVYSIRTDGARSIWEMSGDGSDQRELVPAEENFEHVQVNVTPDNRYLVFQSNRGGSTEIWRSNRDGSGSVAPTSGGENEAPTLTPDGRTILYTSKRNGAYNIWSVDITGGAPRQLTSTGCTWPDVSANGEWFLCIAGTNSDPASRKLMLYEMRGGDAAMSFDLATTAIPYNRSRWAPDGKAIIYKDVVEGLWRQDLAGGKPQKLPGFEDERVFHFTFSRDGSLIYSGGVQMREIVLIDKFQ